MTSDATVVVDLDDVSFLLVYVVNYGVLHSCRRCMHFTSSCMALYATRVILYCIRAALKYDGTTAQPTAQPVHY